MISSSPSAKFHCIFSCFYSLFFSNVAFLSTFIHSFLFISFWRTASILFISLCGIIISNLNSYNPKKSSISFSLFLKRSVTSIISLTLIKIVLTLSLFLESNSFCDPFSSSVFCLILHISMLKSHINSCHNNNYLPLNRAIYLSNNGKDPQRERTGVCCTCTFNFSFLEHPFTRSVIFLDLERVLPWFVCSRLL